MAEEVPTPRTSHRDAILWKEYCLLQKCWIIFRDFIPLILWVAFGLLCFYLGGL